MLSPWSSACGQALLPEAQPGALLSLPQQAAPKGGTPGKRPDRVPGWTRRLTPQPCRHLMGLDVTRDPHLVCTVKEPPETSVQVVPLFVRITKHKNETDASIGSSYQILLQLKEHYSK